MTRKTRTKGLYPSRSLLWVVALIVATILPSAGAVVPVPFDVAVSADVEGAPCSDTSDYDPMDVEYAQSWIDDGHASFNNQVDVPTLGGFKGTGGHHGEVWGCWHGESGGYMPVVSDFTWAGSNQQTGYTGSIKIESAEKKQPVVYSSSAGKANGWIAATSLAKSIDGEFFASATHGGILVPESKGVASLTADATLAGYSYNWQYKGAGAVVGIEPPVCPSRCEDLTLAVYGAGADKDALT